MSNKKRNIAIIIVVILIAVVIIFTQTIGKKSKDQTTQIPETEEVSTMEITEETEEVEKSDELEGSAEVVGAGSGNYSGNKDIEQSETDEDEEENESDIEEYDTVSGVDRFKDGPYEYITIEDLGKYGNKLVGFNIYTVGTVKDLADGKIVFDADGLSVVAYNGRSAEIKKGDQVAFYGYVVEKENDEDKGDAFVCASILKVGDGTNAYKESSTSKSLSSLFGN